MLLRFRLDRRCPKLLAFLICLGIAVMLVLGAQRARSHEQVVDEEDNLRVLGQLLSLYASDHAGHYPAMLGDLVLSFNADPALFVVAWGSSRMATGPTARQRAGEINAGGHCSYRFVASGVLQEDVKHYVILYDDDGPNPDGRTCCLFGDGHTEFVTVADVMQGTVVPLMRRCFAPATTAVPRSAH